MHITMQRQNNLCGAETTKSKKPLKDWPAALYIQAGFVIASHAANRSHKTAAGGVVRHYDMAVLCVLMAAVVSRLMFFGEETEWAQMVCLTGAGRNHFFTEVPPFQAHGALRRIWFMDGCTALLSVFRRRLLITFFKDTGKCKLVIKS